MLLANVSRRCYFSAEMSHRRGALSSGHRQRRRSPRHERNKAERRRSGAPAPDAHGGAGNFWEGRGFGVEGGAFVSAAADLPGRKRWEGDCD